MYVVAVGFLADLFLFFVVPLPLLLPERPVPPSVATDAVAVLFHGFNGNKDGLDNETKRRMNYALDLVRKKGARGLILSGGRRPKGRAQGSVFMAEYALREGISRQMIFADPVSRDSRGNLRAIEAIMDQKGWKTVTIVTSPYHLKRIKIVARDLLRPGVHFVSYDPESADPPLARCDLWRSAHCNLTGLVAWKLFPEKAYRKAVGWLRENTEY